MSVTINCQPENFLSAEIKLEMTTRFLEGAPECTTLKLCVGSFPNDHEFTVFAPPRMHDRFVRACEAFNAIMAESADQLPEAAE